MYFAKLNYDTLKTPYDREKSNKQQNILYKKFIPDYKF